MPTKRGHDFKCAAFDNIEIVSSVSVIIKSVSLGDGDIVSDDRT
jgi:hypothetical protein